LYTAGTDSAARRSAQTALHHVTHMVLRLMAPILSFTVEEAWAVMHPGREESIFFHTWKDVLPPQEGEKELLARWERIRALRAIVVKSLEDSRGAGLIGSSLQAEVLLDATGDDLQLLRSLGDDLKYVLITSQAAVREVAAAQPPVVHVKASPYTKCERCWHWRRDVGIEPRHATICGRCVSNLEGPGEARFHA